MSEPNIDIFYNEFGIIKYLHSTDCLSSNSRMKCELKAFIFNDIQNQQKYAISFLLSLTGKVLHIRHQACHSIFRHI